MGRALWFCSVVLVMTLNSVVTASEDSQEIPTTQTADCIGCNDEIPIEFGNEVNQVDTYADYVRNFIDLDTVDQRDQIFLLGNGSVDDSTLYERSVAIRPKPAACIPDVSIVSLRPETDTDPTIVYFPSCTRVKRCGGCCSHKLLSESFIKGVSAWFGTYINYYICNSQVVNQQQFNHTLLRLVEMISI